MRNTSVTLRFPVLFFGGHPSINIWATGVLRWRLCCGLHSHTAAPHPRQCFEKQRGWGEEHHWCRGVWFGSFHFYCDLSTYPFDQSLLWHPHCWNKKTTTQCSHQTLYEEIIKGAGHKSFFSTWAETLKIKMLSIFIIQSQLLMLFIL